MGTDSWIWILLGALAIAFVVGGSAWALRRRENDGGVARALRSIAVDRLEDVVMPDGMGGEIHIEHLLLTGRGIVVINVKRFEGAVFASDRMDEWTVIRDGKRSSIVNPQRSLYDRVAAVKRLVRDVEVSGFILFPEGADFSKGQPKDIVLPSTLIAAYPQPEPADRERVTVAFQPHWERIRAAADATGRRAELA